ncbi:MAG: enoyl-CoA hydratase-related protein [Thermoanaerobaculia bacterium]|nr:enoyl-CoA hydratase-related protein [Thermoanaerobaculia bacterium]
MSDTIRLDVDGRRATLTLAKPPLNILDLDLLAELETRLGELTALPDLQLLVVRGDGGKAFSAGVSIQDHTPDKIDRMLLGFHGALEQLRAVDAFTVAAVDGHCLGGGLELACCCDLVVASERSRFGQPEIQLGCFPPVAAAILPRRIGAGATLELLLSGRTVDAAEALALRLVDRVVPAAELANDIERIAEWLLAKSAVATRLTKRAVRAGLDRPFGAALKEAERLYLRELAASEDMVEGIAAFLAKRPPEWRHR